MSDPTETARRVIDLDARRAELDALDVAVDLANAAPELARALVETQAALAAATEEQSRAWALLTGERWTQTRAEGSLVEAAARMRDQLAAANARAETADRQIAVHEASAQEQLRLSLAVGAAMREVTQTEIGSGNHAAARARWEEAKKKFAAFQLAPLAGPLERIEAERDALRAEAESLRRERDDLSHAMLALVTLAIDSFGYGTAPMPAAVRKSVPLSGKHLHDFLYEKSVEMNALRDERRTARGSVRELVDGLREARERVALEERENWCPNCDQIHSDDSSDDERALAKKIDTLLAKHAAPAPTPELARNQPCGCVVCRCEDDDRCTGCGAKNCGTHPVGQIPDPVFAPTPADAKENT